jgi:hypothetical protein
MVDDLLEVFVKPLLNLAVRGLRLDLFTSLSVCAVEAREVQPTAASQDETDDER